MTTWSQKKFNNFIVLQVMKCLLTILRDYEQVMNV